MAAGPAWPRTRPTWSRRWVDEGARVTVLASEEDGLPAVAHDGTLEVRRVWRRGPSALPTAAAAARATGARAVHLQHELFMYGGPAAVPGVVPALAALQGRRAVVTMHHVVDPADVDASFTAHAPRARPGAGRPCRGRHAAAHDPRVRRRDRRARAVVRGGRARRRGRAARHRGRRGRAEPRGGARRARRRRLLRALLRLPGALQGARGRAGRGPAGGRRGAARDRRRRAPAPSRLRGPAALDRAATTSASPASCRTTTSRAGSPPPTSRCCPTRARSRRAGRSRSRSPTARRC